MSDMKQKVKNLYQKIRKKLTAPVVPVVKLEGVIGASRFSQALNLESVAELLDQAFHVDKAPAVALIVNSPGGSPVQSALIHDRIRLLADKHDKEVLVFLEDVAASGGYWIACAGDEIIGNAASIVGSIGVISAGFGFPELMKKHGVERRVYTQGKHKSLLDPFQPEDEEGVGRIKELQGDLHNLFIDHVKSRRGDKLDSETDLFEGDVWTSERAIKHGLIDSVGNIREVLMERYGEDVLTPLLKKESGFFRRMIAGESRLMDERRLVESAADMLQSRTLWGRFGL